MLATVKYNQNVTEDSDNDYVKCNALRMTKVFWAIEPR